MRFMSGNREQNPERRSFLSRLKLGALGAAVGGTALAQVKPAPATWEPTRHKEDDWLDQIPGKHRMVIDAPTIDGLGEALLFANNYITANQTDYALKQDELAVVIVIRHFSTAFGFSDAMWAKYGASMDPNFQDPKTKAAAKLNVYNANGYGGSLTSRGITLDAIAKQGVHFAICAMATGRVASQVATATGADRAAITKELTSNMIPNGRMVPAGIVAVNRAQERGYSFVRA